MSKNRFLGGTWPVVQRELREGARRPFNYWLRVGAATAGLLMVVYIMNENRDEEDKVMGQYLFAGLHVVLMGLICLVVPLMTADCIAREKREGTLGLLFLTPLTAGGIVAGKGLAQALRALTLWVSVAPVLTIPFVMGGIGWAEASAYLALEFSALVLCLAAGLLASTLVKGRGAAFVVALLLGASIVSVFCQLVCFSFLAQIPFDVEWPLGYAGLLAGIPGPNLSFWGVIPSRAAISHAWNDTLWLSPLPALLLFSLVLRFAAWRVAKSWQDKTPSLRQESLVHKYCTPLFQRWFARRTRRSLDRNPIAWLQQYSWKARLVKWVLCLAFVIVATGYVSGVPVYYGFGETIQVLFVFTIAAGMTFAGLNSFAAEKRSGALELILITPISVNQIIFGRVCGVWKQFLPAALILALFDAGNLWVCGDLKLGLPFNELISRLLRDYLPARLSVISVFLTLPVFALYFALRVKNQIAAAGMTWAALLLPSLFVMLWFEMVTSEFDETAYVWMSLGWCVVNLALALVACVLLRHCLSRRLYSF